MSGATRLGLWVSVRVDEARVLGQNVIGRDIVVVAELGRALHLVVENLTDVVDFIRCEELSNADDTVLGVLRRSRVWLGNEVGEDHDGDLSQDCRGARGAGLLRRVGSRTSLETWR